MDFNDLARGNFPLDEGTTPAGSVILYYSEKQMLGHKAYLTSGGQMNTADEDRISGIMIAIDLTAGKAVPYTDIVVLDGNEELIKQIYQPLNGPKSDIGEDESYPEGITPLSQCTDRIEVRRSQAEHLFLLTNELGEPVKHSLNAMKARYGVNGALVILAILDNIAAEMQPEIIVGTKSLTPFQAMQLECASKADTPKPPQA